MPAFELPIIQGSMSKDEMAAVVSKMSRELYWLLNNMDSLNVRSIDTSLTTVSGGGGKTVIQGPLILMYDAANTLRLRMGLDESTNEFVFEMYNELGVLTITIDSNGNAVFVGTISASTINASDINGGTMTASTINASDINGGTMTASAIIGGSITASTIDTEEDVLVGGLISMRGSTENTIEFSNDAFISAALGFLQISTFSGGDVQIVSDGRVSISAGAGQNAVLNCGAGANLLFNSGGSFEVYINSVAPSNKVATFGDLPSGASGTFTSQDGKTITVSNGIIIGIV